MMVLLPWICWTLGYVYRYSKAQWLRPLIVFFIFPLILISCFELFLRGNSLTNDQLDFTRYVNRRYSTLEKYTGLFGSPDDGCLVARDVEYPFVKPPGRYRIVTLGSSSTWGSGAGDSVEGSYPFNLESALRERGFDIEVVNAGVCGASLYMLYVYFDEVLSFLEPDLLILYFGENRDKKNLETFYKGLQSKVKTSPYLDSTIKLAASEYIRYDSRRMVEVFSRLSSLRAFQAGVRLGGWINRPAGPSQVRDAYMHYGCGEFVAGTPPRIVHSAIEKGTKLLLVPEISFDAAASGQQSHEYFDSFSSLADDFSEEGVYFLNLLEYFGSIYQLEASQSGISPIYRDKVHMSAFGYRLLAEQIALFLIEKKILPDPQP